MESIKIAGLTLKSEVPSEKEREEDAIIQGSDPAFSDAAPEGIIDGLRDEDEIPEHESTLVEKLTSIIKRVEEWPKDDNTIKAIGKLKGALQLLS